MRGPAAPKTRSRGARSAPARSPLPAATPRPGSTRSATRGRCARTARLLAVGDDGAIIRSDDQGKTWQVSAGFPGAGWLAVSPLPNGPVLFGNDQSMFKSGDGAVTFSPVAPPPSKTSFGRGTKGVFAPSGAFYAFGLAGDRAVYRSDDGGASFTVFQAALDHPSLGSIAPTALAFAQGGDQPQFLGGALSVSDNFRTTAGALFAPSGDGYSS